MYTPPIYIPPIYTPTSVELSRLLERADAARVANRVPVVWLLAQLGRRSFGLTFFVMGMVALVPGASMLVGVLLAWPAVQLMLGHETAELPRLIGRRTVAVARLARVIALLTPRLVRLERVVRPRWPELFSTTRRMTGVAMLLLGLSMLSPVPFSHVVPALVIMLLALAYLEEDGLVLLIALAGATVALAITAATVWGTVETIDWIDPADH
jgi:hypothetical protein